MGVRGPHTGGGDTPALFAQLEASRGHNFIRRHGYRARPTVGFWSTAASRPRAAVDIFFEAPSWSSRHFDATLGFPGEGPSPFTLPLRHCAVTWLQLEEVGLWDIIGGYSSSPRISPYTAIIRGRGPSLPVGPNRRVAVEPATPIGGPSRPQRNYGCARNRWVSISFYYRPFPTPPSPLDYPGQVPVRGGCRGDSTTKIRLSCSRDRPRSRFR